MNASCWLIEQSDYNVEEISKLVAPHIHVKEGQKIFVKPNWVIDPWKGEEDSWCATVTHTAMIEAVLMVLKEKTNGRAEVIVGDAPMTRTKINIVLRELKIAELIAKYNQGEFRVSQIDIRRYYWHHVANMCVKRVPLPGDPEGSITVDLGEDSMFSDKDSVNYMATDTVHPVAEFHSKKRNAYEVSRSILSCDVFINLPKLKTHRLAGFTCAMKNLVGSISNKNCVPHSTYGSDKKGGDCFPEGDAEAMDGHSGIRGVVDWITKKKIPLVNYAFIPAKIVYDRFFAAKNYTKKAYGAWYGNDTIWRSVLDLNRILLYCDRNGTMHSQQQREYLCIADAIVAGEGEGPLHPTPKKASLILIADNPVALDATACCLMGFDSNKIPVLRNAFFKNRPWRLTNFEIEEIELKSNQEKWNGKRLTSIQSSLNYHFRPSAGWRGAIERTDEP